MAKPSHRNNWKADPPRRPALKVGDTFECYLGPRRAVWPGVRDFFQRDNRRYWCEVVSVRLDHYKVGGRYGYRLNRSRHAPTVKVLAPPVDLLPPKETNDAATTAPIRAGVPI
jgi:hypothetical protein